MRHYLCSGVLGGIALGIVLSGRAADGDAIPKSPSTGLANPAAVFCVEQGGRFEIRKTNVGSRGFCMLPDGTVVDAWTFFREYARPEVK